MVHILLLILKIIGLVLLILLAFILILLLTVLFTPLRCTLKASIDNSPESAQGSVRFHWLFHLISGEASWQDGELTWHFRAAWKKYSNADEPVPDPVKTEDHTPKPKDSASVPAHADTPAYIPVVKTEKTEDPEKSVISDQPEEPKKEQLDDHKAGDEHIKSHSGSKTAAARPQAGKKPSRIMQFINRIRSAFQRIKYTFQRLCDKIKALENKKERISRFLGNDIHQKAFSRLIRETRGLLKRLRPKRASIDITFGFEDPAHTGYTLAGISLIYPVIGEYTYLTPDFEHKVLKGNVFIKEKIRLIYAVIFAWNMLLDRNVRTTYRHLRKFKW